MKEKRALMFSFFFVGGGRGFDIIHFLPSCGAWMYVTQRYDKMYVHFWFSLYINVCVCVCVCIY